MSHSINPADVNFRTQNFRTHDPGKHNLKSATRTGNERNADCRAIENTGPSLALHNLVLTEGFHARPEALTVTELFQRTHGRFTASGLLEFTRAVVWLEEEGLLEPVFPQELAGSKEKAERHFSESTSKQVAAGGGCAPLLKDNCGPQPKDICASQQGTERCIKSAITAKGEMYLFGQTQPGAAAVHSSKATTLHNSALHNNPGKLAKSEIADGLTLVAEPTSQHMVEQTLEPAPEAPDGNGGDAAPKLTSPLAICRLTSSKHTAAPVTFTACKETAEAPDLKSDAQSEATQEHTNAQASVIEQLFPEIFRTARRLEDVCHCGELAHRTCPCGARICHNHFYDGDGNLARRDHAGFCAECVDLIREEAAGIERYGRSQ